MRGLTFVVSKEVLDRNYYLNSEFNMFVTIAFISLKSCNCKTQIMNLDNENSYIQESSLVNVCCYGKQRKTMIAFTYYKFSIKLSCNTFTSPQHVFFSMLIPSESTLTSYWLLLSLGSDNPYNYLNNSKRFLDPFTTVTTDNTRFLSSTLTPPPHGSQNDYFTQPEPLQWISIAFRTSSKLYHPTRLCPIIPLPLSAINVFHLFSILQTPGPLIPSHIRAFSLAAPSVLLSPIPED